MDYELQSGEVLNGGYSVVIGDYTLRNIGSYAPSWTNVYDDSNTFTDYLGKQVKPFLGRRFSLKITTGRLSPVDFNALVEALKSRDIAVNCTDYVGSCYCDDIPADLKQANFLGTRYNVSFTLTANDLVDSGGGL